MSKRSAADANSGNPANIQLDNVNTIWLEASPTERYLLLEDPETGDVLMPLIYMKHVLEANYSRKLASLKHRMVTVPVAGPLSKQEGLLYWQWAFESPHSVKVIVRKEIGEATPQGHLRLVLIPIVYNALAGRADLRTTPLFRTLHRAVRVSTYWPLLRPIPASTLAELDADAQIPSAGPMPPVLFRGPRVLETTAMKYMFMFTDQEEMEQNKRNRTTGTSNVDNGLLTAAIVGAGVVQPTNLVDLMNTSAVANALMVGSLPHPSFVMPPSTATAATTGPPPPPPMVVSSTAAAPLPPVDGTNGVEVPHHPAAPQPSTLPPGTSQNNTIASFPLPSPPPPSTTAAAAIPPTTTTPSIAAITGTGTTPAAPPLAPPGVAATPHQLQQQQQQKILQAVLMQQRLQAANAAAGQLPTATGAAPTLAQMFPHATLQHFQPQAQQKQQKQQQQQHQMMMTGGVNPTTAEVVRQVVDMKMVEVKKEMQRLKTNMIDLYSSVFNVALQQGTPTPQYGGVGGSAVGAYVFPDNGMMGLHPPPSPGVDGMHYNPNYYNVTGVANTLDGRGVFIGSGGGGGGALPPPSMQNYQHLYIPQHEQQHQEPSPPPLYPGTAIEVEAAEVMPPPPIYPGTAIEATTTDAVAGIPPPPAQGTTTNEERAPAVDFSAAPPMPNSEEGLASILQDLQTASELGGGSGNGGGAVGGGNGGGALTVLGTPSQEQIGSNPSNASQDVLAMLVKTSPPKQQKQQDQQE